MKKIVFIVMILFSAFATVAQNNKINHLLTPEQKAEKKLNELDKLVSLNEQQKNNAYQIYLKQEIMYVNDSKDLEPNSEAYQKAEMNRRKYVDDHLKLVLNKEQFQKLINYRNQLIEKRKPTGLNKLLESDI